MAGKRITDLDELTNAELAAGDSIPIVDVDAGSTKKIPISEIDARYQTQLDALQALIDALEADVADLQGGGGGGGGLIFTPVAGFEPVFEQEFGVGVYKFADGEDQQLRVYVPVPAGHVEGKQIFMDIGHYSPSSASETMLLKATIGLIKAGTDPADTPSAERESINTALINTVANQSRNAALDLSDELGEVDGSSVEGGDWLVVTIFRDSDNDTDTADIRFNPSLVGLRAVTPA